ncbi:MmgE/PrpD family protein [Ruegeria sp. 2205SS24-7]|uniref:MmgE/PrpD family protein n=1 Tax=Ruegeria discodermiae TaxID=3064389 RepID=UPI0027406513|nr:MmgE/PrpD family protein [Ruegeria sp. 2205SS24-7]MDP5220385.1 MmgE/PrpD family protein [Ruegeria sp. 2205SS24-7]
MGLISEIAEWTYGHEMQWSAQTHERALFGIADTIGCIVAAADHDVVQKVGNSFFRSEDGSAFNVFNSKVSCAQTAALINGTAAHVLEIDDNFYPALTHASAQAVPTLLALAQEYQCSGRDILNAYIQSIHIQAALASAMGRNHTLTGWHATGTLATLASAAAGAKMVGLNPNEIGNAISIACSMAASTKAQFGTETKSVHCGLSSKNSVCAVELAMAGLEGSEDAIDGNFGFFRLYNGTKDPELGKVLAYLHGSNALENSGLAPKRHACCGSAHKCLDAAEDLVIENGLELEMISRIEAEVGITNRQNLRFDSPKDGLQARFSLPYAMVVFLYSGKFWLNDLDDDAVLRPEIQAHLGKVKVSVLDVAESSIPIDQPVAHNIRIVLEDGRTYSARRAYAKGTLADPFSPKDYSHKFQLCCSERLGSASTGALWGRLMKLDDQKTANQLLLA